MSAGLVVEVDLDGAGQPRSAVAAGRVAVPRARLWSYIADVDGYAGVVPMLHKVKRDGDRVTVHLKFKIALFSVGFHFVADAVYEEGRWLELRWVDGEPRGLAIRFELDDDGADACRLRARISFDVFSLGWLAKYFLKHHPEIQYGIFPGCAIALHDSLRRVAEARG